MRWAPGSISALSVMLPSASNAGELRYDQGLDLVQIDTDGNGTADFAIHVAVNNLVQSDFIL